MASKLFGGIVRSRICFKMTPVFVNLRMRDTINFLMIKQIPSPSISHGLHQSPATMLEFEEEARLEAERRNQARREADNQEKIKGDLLDASLEEVLVYGWTKAAVSAACVKLGYPSVVQALVKDPGVELVLHHIKTSNRKLDEWMSEEVSRLKEQGHRIKVGLFVREAVMRRLDMNSKYILAHRWTEALALTANPLYCKDTLESIQQLCDDIWYRAGDTTTDYNWYTKRISLAAILAATEVFMIQDQSPDFQETWLFLDRRLADIRGLPDISQLPGDILGIAGGLATTFKNMAGIQK